MELEGEEVEFGGGCRWHNRCFLTVFDGACWPVCGHCIGGHG